MRYELLILSFIVTVTGCSSVPLAQKPNLAIMEHFGSEVAPYMLDGKRINTHQHVLRLAPGKHTVSVKLSWGGLGRETQAKSTCFIAKPGEYYIVRAAIEGDDAYVGDWHPYVEKNNQPSGALSKILLSREPAETC
jgi:hypothetical protein